jgi:hypothetical protein
MRYFILLGFFLLATLLGKAQTPATTAPVPLASSAPAPETDTLAALHNFYQHKRRALPRVLLITGGLVALTFFVHDTFSEPSHNLSDYVFPVYTGALSFAVFSGELLYYRQYNKRHERRTIEEFKAHQLRPSTREQLKPTYFQQTPPHGNQTQKVYWR